MLLDAALNAAGALCRSVGAASRSDHGKTDRTALAPEQQGEPMKTVGYDMYAIPFEVFRGQNQPIWVDVTCRRRRPPVPRSVSRQHARALRRIARDADRMGFQPPRRAPPTATISASSAALPGYLACSPTASDSGRSRPATAARGRAPALPAGARSLTPTVNPKDGSLTIDRSGTSSLPSSLRRTTLPTFRSVVRSAGCRTPRSTRTTRRSRRRAGKARQLYADYYQYLEKNGWADRAYVYLLDEPNTRENYEQVLVLDALVRRRPS